MSFLFAADGKKLKSYECKSKKNIGYDSDGEDGVVYFTLPKTIIIDFSDDIRLNGYTFNYSEVFQTSSSIYCIQQSQKGTLKSLSCGQDFTKGVTFTSSCYMLNYKPNYGSTYDRIDYSTSSTVKKREALLFLIVTEGYDAAYSENEDGPSFSEFPCRTNYHQIVNDSSVCLSEATKKNYFLVESDNLYHACDISCAACANITTNCTQCKDGYKENPFIPYNCYYPCQYKYYFNETKYYVCLGENDDCPSEFPLLIVDTRECVKECTQDYPLIIEEKNECHNKCTEEYPYKEGNLNKCKQDCFLEFPFLVEETNHCVTRCNDPICQYCVEHVLFQYGMLCKNECPEKMVPNQNNNCTLNIEGLSDAESVQYNTTSNISQFMEYYDDLISILITNSQFSPEFLHMIHLL